MRIETSMPLLVLDDVSIGYTPQAPLLSNVSFSLPAGTGILMMGLNGAGKTTLIHTLLNMQPALAGTLSIGGITHTNPASRAHLAYLPEDFSPPLNWNVADFLHSTALLYGQKLNPTHALEILTTQLKHAPTILKQKIAHCSKGMRQHIALLSLFLSHRPLWILDEPFNGLDMRARQWVCQSMERHLAQGGSIWLTSHDLTGLEHLPFRSALIHEGQWHNYPSINDGYHALLHAENNTKTSMAQDEQP
jgi:ABC-2 type transport system ATP-binding protein